MSVLCMQILIITRIASSLRPWTLVIFVCAMLFHAGHSMLEGHGHAEMPVLQADDAGGRAAGASRRRSAAAAADAAAGTPRPPLADAGGESSVIGHLFYCVRAGLRAIC